MYWKSTVPFFMGHPVYTFNTQSSSLHTLLGAMSVESQKGIKDNMKYLQHDYMLIWTASEPLIFMFIV